MHCLITDEGSRRGDALYGALRPMVAVSGGPMILLSTPFGQRGPFYRVWSQRQSCLKIRVTAAQSPRLTPDLLDEELVELGPRWYGQEYGGQSVEAKGQVFSDAAIAAAFRDEIDRLFPGEVGPSILRDLHPPFHAPDREPLGVTRPCL